MAEGKGFEPPKGGFDLANRRLQPLGHPSAKMGHGAEPPRRMQELILSAAQLVKRLYQLA